MGTLFRRVTRKLMTADEVLRLPLDEALIILRGQKVLKVGKFDYTLHPESGKLRACRASDHVPAWRRLPETEEPDFSRLMTPKQKPKTPRKKPVPEKPASGNPYPEAPDAPPTPPPLSGDEAAEKVDTTAYIWYNVIIKYRRWHYG